MKKVFLLFIFCFSISINAQQSEVFKLRKFRVAVLNDSIQETSALSFFNDKLYTLNDSGNLPELYEINKNSGKIIKTHKTNLVNKDWEALANDGENFYIGDFGNNRGERKDLKIYKIPFENNQLQVDSTKIISFYYPEQTDFTPRNIKTDFDLEAMVYYDGKIHLFTKEWVSKSTTHYTLDPNNFENQAAQKVEKYDTGFVITDAYYYDKKLYVVGYTKRTKVFLMVFNESESGIFFDATPKKFSLGSAFSVGQVEGIAVDEKGIYISSEKFNNPIKRTKPYLYFIPKDKIKTE